MLDQRCTPDLCIQSVEHLLLERLSRVGVYGGCRAEIELGVLCQALPRSIGFTVGGLPGQLPSACQCLDHVTWVTRHICLIDLFHPLIVAPIALESRGEADESL